MPDMTIKYLCPNCGLNYDIKVTYVLDEIEAGTFDVGCDPWSQPGSTTAECQNCNYTG